MSLMPLPPGFPVSQGGYSRMPLQGGLNHPMPNAAAPTGKPGMGAQRNPNMLTPTHNPGTMTDAQGNILDIFNKPMFDLTQQTFTPQTGGPTPRTPVPNPTAQFQALQQNFTPQVAGPTPQQPPPFVPPTPMPFINRPMPQFQQPNFSFLGGQIAPPNPAMNMTMPSMKGLFGIR